LYWKRSDGTGCWHTKFFLEYLICFWWRVNGVSFANPCDVLNTAFFTEWTLFISLLFVITIAWRQRNSKHLLIWWLINFLQIYFIFARIFARFCKFQKLSPKETAKESAKRREPTLTKVSLF
jgi:hypothetical protein